ncbi:hypothetical protein, partial [Mesotoga prima]|uniref:hypothetical protein n=1 Tax=Mesotoga prima TaxID=1184387 RepID=UPI002FDAF07F
NEPILSEKLLFRIWAYENVVGGSRWRVRKGKRNWLIVERFSVIRVKAEGDQKERIEILKQVQNDCM